MSDDLIEEKFKVHDEKIDNHEDRITNLEKTYIIMAKMETTLKNVQTDISDMKNKIGKVYNVIIENMTDDGKYFIGRSYMDVPSEDGVIYVDYDENIVINEYVNVKIYDSTE